MTNSTEGSVHGNKELRAKILKIVQQVDNQKMHSAEATDRILRVVDEVVTNGKATD